MLTALCCPITISLNSGIHLFAAGSRALSDLYTKGDFPPGLRIAHKCEFRRSLFFVSECSLPRCRSIPKRCLLFSLLKVLQLHLVFDGRQIRSGQYSSEPTSRWFYTLRRERISGFLFSDTGGSNESQVSYTPRSARELVSNTTMCCRMCHNSEQHGAAPSEPMRSRNEHRPQFRSECIFGRILQCIE